jgi:hypothetical protein
MALKLTATLNDPTPGGLVPGRIEAEGENKQLLYYFLANAVAAYARRAGIHPGAVQYSIRFEDVPTPAGAPAEAAP